MTRRNRLASFGSTRADEDGGPEEEEPPPEGRRLGSGVATTQEDNIVAATSRTIQVFATICAPIAGIALSSAPDRLRRKVSDLIM
ncbi:MAG TPA: hypothetical protein VF452_22220 [Candidatus Binatia bacterium]